MTLDWAVLHTSAFKFNLSFDNERIKYWTQKKSEEGGLERDVEKDVEGFDEKSEFGADVCVVSVLAVPEEQYEIEDDDQQVDQERKLESDQVNDLTILGDVVLD